MDKVHTGSLEDIFSLKEHRLVYQGGQYREAISLLSEPGLATAKITSITTPGICLSTVSFTAERKLMLVDHQEGEGLQAVFSLRGGIESRFATLRHPISIFERRHSLQYNSNFQGTHLLHPGRFEALSLVFNIQFVKSLVQQQDCRPAEALADSMEKKSVFLPSPAMLEMQPRMNEIVQALQQNPFGGLTRYLFFEAKMLELFALQLDHICIANQPATKEVISPQDREKLRALRNFIEGNYLLPLKLSELSRQFALNEFKLKKGYKHLFQTTVFGHITHLRMLKAKELLTQKQMNVSEVAHCIGYNNTGSFSAEFKKRFGCSPSQY